MKKILLVIVVYMLCCLIWSPEPGAKKKVIRIGDKLPGFFLKDIKGENFFLNEYVGEKARGNYKGIVFSLTASYCKPCKKEIPELGKLMEKYKDRGLKIFLVALEREKQTRKLIAETKTTLPVLIDKYLVVPKLLGNAGIPFTVLIDKEGTVRFINTGFSEKNADQFMERFENAVVAVLGIDDSDSAE